MNIIVHMVKTYRLCHRSRHLRIYYNEALQSLMDALFIEKSGRR